MFNPLRMFDCCMRPNICEVRSNETTGPQVQTKNFFNSSVPCTSFSSIIHKWINENDMRKPASSNEKSFLSSVFALLQKKLQPLRKKSDIQYETEFKDIDRLTFKSQDLFEIRLANGEKVWRTQEETELYILMQSQLVTLDSSNTSEAHISNDELLCFTQGIAYENCQSSKPQIEISTDLENAVSSDSIEGSPTQSSARHNVSHSELTTKDLNINPHNLEDFECELSSPSNDSPFENLRSPGYFEEEKEGERLDSTPSYRNPFDEAMNQSITPTNSAAINTLASEEITASEPSTNPPNHSTIRKINDNEFFIDKDFFVNFSDFNKMLCSKELGHDKWPRGFYVDKTLSQTGKLGWLRSAWGIVLLKMDAPKLESILTQILYDKNLDTEHLSLFEKSILENPQPTIQKIKNIIDRQKSESVYKNADSDVAGCDFTRIFTKHRYLSAATAPSQLKYPQESDFSDQPKLEKDLIALTHIVLERERQQDRLMGHTAQSINSALAGDGGDEVLISSIAQSMQTNLISLNTSNNEPGLHIRFNTDLNKHDTVHFKKLLNEWTTSSHELTPDQKHDRTWGGKVEKKIVEGEEYETESIGLCTYLLSIPMLHTSNQGHGLWITKNSAASFDKEQTEFSKQWKRARLLETL